MNKASVLANKDRATYDGLLEKFSGYQISQDYVRVEARIQNNKSTYEFDPRRLALKDNTFRVNQKGVNDNDIFFVTGMGIFIDCRKIAKQSTAVLQTYPSTTAFAASNASVEDLQAFFNGEVSIKVGNTVYTDGNTSALNRTVPQTQGATGIVNQTSYDTAFVDTTPYPVFSGQSDNKITLNINTFPGFDVEAKLASGAEPGTELLYENVLTLFFIGYRVLNAAK